MLIETERLLLRPITLADLDEFVAIHLNSDVTRFVRPLDRAHAEERLRLAEREWAQRGYGMLAVIDKAGGRFLGRAGLRYWPQFDETELGWLLRRDEWGNGYATEGGLACVDWGFTERDFPYLTAMIHPENTPSVRVAERLGLTPMREDLLFGDRVIVYAISRAAWRNRSGPAAASASA